MLVEIVRSIPRNDLIANDVMVRFYISDQAVSVVWDIPVPALGTRQQTVELTEEEVDAVLGNVAMQQFIEELALLTHERAVEQAHDFSLGHVP